MSAPSIHVVGPHGAAQRKGLRLLGVDLHPENLRSAGRSFWIWVGGLVVLWLAGTWAWSRQWPNAEWLAVTGMRDVFVWGFYIQNFIFFVGLSAGELIVYSSVVLFGVEQFRPLERLAVLQAALCVLMAMLFLLPDLGNPQRVFWFLKTPNFHSIFVFDFMVLSTHLVLCSVDLWALLSGRMHGRTELVMTAVSLPVAIGVHSITAWVLGLVKGRDLWHTALMAPLFISSAITSGLALLVLLAWTLRRAGRFHIPDDTFVAIGKLLGVIAIIDVFFMGCELLTVYWPASQTPEHAVRMDLITWGRYLPFLLATIVAGGLAPFFIVTNPRTRASVPAIVVAAALAFGGVFSKRAVLLIMGFAVSPLGVRGDYWPTLVEWGVAGGVWALGALIVSFAVLFLDVRGPTEAAPR